jgi:hypothetical protein
MRSLGKLGLPAMHADVTLHMLMLVSSQQACDQIMSGSSKTKSGSKSRSVLALFSLVWVVHAFPKQDQRWQCRHASVHSAVRDRVHGQDKINVGNADTLRQGVDGGRGRGVGDIHVCNTATLRKYGVHYMHARVLLRCGSKTGRTRTRWTVG